MPMKDSKDNGGSCAANGKSQQAMERNELEERMRQSMAKVKNKILVMSGKGGVGKSTFAVNLAVALAKRGNEVGLMDVDLHGPSVPNMLGLTDAKTSSDGVSVHPIKYMDGLKMISMGNFLPNKNDAVIWRGPKKIGAIRQFLGDVEWGQLDYLIFDAPPGTGDEPLTIAQDVPGVKAVVVTTPQEISLADVRKSVNFCKQVSMPVVGVVENMSGFACPECGHRVDLFGAGGGEKLAIASNVPFLGAIPIDPEVVKSGEGGRPLMVNDESTATRKAYDAIVDAIVSGSSTTTEEKISMDSPSSTKTVPNGCRKIAIPTAQGVLCAHFGHCEKFTVMTVQNGEVLDTAYLTPPPHEPGLLPRWLAEQKAKVIIAGGMGQRAQELFGEQGIEVIIGAPSLAPEALVSQYLAGTLESGENVCDH
jgi:ATP-binding protein involved in chromosome partitioning